MMRKNVYLSVCVFSMAVAVAWWNLERSNSKSLPEGSAGHEEKDRVVLDQPDDRVNDSAVDDAHGQNHKMDGQVEMKLGKGAKQTCVQKDFVAELEKSLPDGDKRVENETRDVDLDSDAKSAQQAQAVRLADDFTLPSAMMHMAAIEAGHEGAGPMTPEIKAAVDHLIDEFYRDVAQVGELGANATSETDFTTQEQSEFSSNEESGEVTWLIEPTEQAMQATERANQSHQLLFGDVAANRFGVQSKLEVRLSVLGQE